MADHNTTDCAAKPADAAKPGWLAWINSVMERGDFEMATHIALNNGHIPTLERLIACGYLTDARIKLNSEYAFYAAAMGGHIDLFLWLEGRGLIPGLLSHKDGLSYPLHAAVTHGQIASLNWLLHRSYIGADNFRDNSFKAVVLAVVFGQLASLEWIDSHGFLTPNDYLVVQRETVESIACAGDFGPWVPKIRGAEREAVRAAIRDWLAAHVPPAQEEDCARDA